MEELIKIEHLKFSFQESCLFSNLSLSIPKNKITAIMGPSGTGKTTLLRLIGGQLEPDEGNVFFKGIDIHKLSRKKLYAIRQNMGLLFQSGALFTSLTVFENVAFPLREHTDLPEELIRSLVLMKLEMVGLRGARDLMPNQLSGGMARRVALARALVMDPELMMYDEPFTGLDPISKGVIVKLIKEIHSALNMTTILVSHDVKETIAIADFVYILSAGNVIGAGDPKTILQNTKPEISQFMQGLPDGVVPFHYPALNFNKDLLHHD